MKFSSDNWESAAVSPETAIEKIRPGMLIFLGTAMAEPRTMARHLMTSDAKNVEDLELITADQFRGCGNAAYHSIPEFSPENLFFRLGGQ